MAQHERLLAASVISEAWKQMFTVNDLIGASLQSNSWAVTDVLADTPANQNNASIALRRDII
jgi:hypothetical protein